MSCAVHILMLAKRLIPNTKTRVFLLYFYIFPVVAKQAALWMEPCTGFSLLIHVQLCQSTVRRGSVVHSVALLFFLLSPQCCVSSVSLGRIVSILSLETGCMPAAGLGLHRGKVPVGWRCVFSRAQSQISQRNFDLLHLCVCVCINGVNKSSDFIFVATIMHVGSLPWKFPDCTVSLLKWYWWTLKLLYMLFLNQFCF